MGNLIEMDFNKESVGNYYRQQVPEMKENGLIQTLTPSWQNFPKDLP